MSLAVFTAQHTQAAALGRVAGGNHLTAQNDESEPVETAARYASRRAEEEYRRALDLQMRANVRDPRLAGAFQ